MECFVILIYQKAFCWNNDIERVVWELEKMYPLQFTPTFKFCEADFINSWRLKNGELKFPFHHTVVIVTRVGLRMSRLYFVVVFRSPEQKFFSRFNFVKVIQDRLTNSDWTVHFIRCSDCQPDRCTLFLLDSTGVPNRQREYKLCSEDLETAERDCTKFCWFRLRNFTTFLLDMKYHRGCKRTWALILIWLQMWTNHF